MILVRDYNKQWKYLREMLLVVELEQKSDRNGVDLQEWVLLVQYLSCLTSISFYATAVVNLNGITS